MLTPRKWVKWGYQYFVDTGFDGLEGPWPEESIRLQGMLEFKGTGYERIGEQGSSIHIKIDRCNDVNYLSFLVALKELWVDE